MTTKRLQLKRIHGNRKFGISRDGQVVNMDTLRIVRQHRRGGKGKVGSYWAVSLSGKEFYVHVLMLETYVGPRPFPKAETRHLNDDKFDNRIESLAWGTQSENNDDRVTNGIHHYAKRTQCSKGHDFDGFNGRQRTCSRCARIHNRKMKARAKAARVACPQGHSFDGVRLNKDGTVRQRYCTRCAHDALDRGRQSRWAKQ
jgi:hypothetical protein